MFTYSSQFKIREKKDSNFEESFSNNLAESISGKFSNIYQGNGVIEIENKMKWFGPIWNFYEIISNVKITLRKSNRIVVIDLIVDFSRYSFFYLILAIVVTSSIIIQGDRDIISFLTPFLFFGVGYVFIQISYNKFRTNMINTINKSGGNIISP